VEPELLGRILSVLRLHHGVADDAEISLEANPEDFTLDRAEALLQAGFNRVSFGAQSFDESVLGSLGRRHSPDQIEASVADARAAGFGNVSLDLIFGTPGETDEVWKKTLERALAVEPDHLSCYALTVERGTPLGRAVGGGAPAPDPDVQADRYEQAQRMIDLEQYEVSNWSIAGHQCRYNLTVWGQGEYDAFGNGAHGFRNGRRFRNHRRIDAYMSRVAERTAPRAGEDMIKGWDLELDRLFVGLRRTVGVSHGPGTAALLASEDGRRLADMGVLADDGERLRVARPLLTDAVLRSVMALEAPIVFSESHA
jgi:oxygen-independent coproporphyrinogen-3 oxidase